jgi:hypothetical protein
LRKVEVRGGKVVVEYESRSRTIAVTEAGFRLLPAGAQRVELELGAY